jgi:AcrR family transcriptional regulator
MATPEQRRAALIERLADHVLAHGLEAASLRPLAAAAGTSNRMLLYYFTDKADLIAAVLMCIAARLAAQLEQSGIGARRRSASVLRADIFRIVQQQSFQPTMRIWLELAGRAAREEEPFRTIGRAIALGFQAWIAARVTGASDAARAAAARQILIAVEGMMLLNAFGLGPDPARD